MSPGQLRPRCRDEHRGSVLPRDEWRKPLRYSMQAYGSTGRHFGSRLVFDREGYLFISIGDRGEIERAQDRSERAAPRIMRGSSRFGCCIRSY